MLEVFDLAGWHAHSHYFTILATSQPASRAATHPATFCSLPSILLPPLCYSGSESALHVQICTHL